MIKFNANNHVTVKLTEQGKKIWQSYANIECNRLPVELHKLYHECEKDGILTLQLWELMNVFGRHMEIGSNVMDFNFELEETPAETKNRNFLEKRAIDYAKVYVLLKEYYEAIRCEAMFNHYYGYDSPEATMRRKYYKQISTDVQEFLRLAGETGTFYE